MSPRANKAAFILVLILSLLSLSGGVGTGRQSVSYWLWAGITAHDAPPYAELYVFQGRIFTEDGKTSYERLGLYPHPIKSSKLFLVYRLESQLPDAKTVIEIFQRSVTQWQRHPVTVSGIQLDFDSPTSKLVAYSHFVEDVRKQLPQTYQLSITGLGDWAMSGDRETMRSLSASADEIVFQLYQGRQPLPDVETYLQGLAKYPFPFRVGLVFGYSNPASINRLKRNPNFRGIIYFVQRAI